MGRLTIQEVEKLRKSKVLDDEAVKHLQEQNLVGTRKRGNKRYMSDGNGGRVSPQMYFQGLGKGKKHTKDMLSLKEEWNQLVNKYTKEGK